MGRVLVEVSSVQPNIKVFPKKNKKFFVTIYNFFRKKLAYLKNFTYLCTRFDTGYVYQCLMERDFDRVNRH